MTKPKRTRRRIQTVAAVGAAAGVTFLLSSRKGTGPEYLKQHLRADGSSFSGLSARRSLSLSLPDGKCVVTPAVVPNPPVTPVYAASYPGSGAKMTWNLIEAITGLVTGDEFGYNGHGQNVVSVKTHYPQSDGKTLEWDEVIKRGFIILRNPRYAIPSLHNFVYEVQNNLPPHSTRAPLDEWRRWRDAHFAGQVQAWANLLNYWVKKFRPEDRMIVTYESLTNDETGPAAAQRLSDFLARDPNVHPIDSSSLECVWKAVVKYHETPHLPSLEEHSLSVGSQEMERNLASVRSVAEALRLPSDAFVGGPVQEPAEVLQDSPSHALPPPGRRLQDTQSSVQDKAMLAHEQQTSPSSQANIQQQALHPSMSLQVPEMLSSQEMTQAIQAPAPQESTLASPQLVEAPTPAVEVSENPESSPSMPEAPKMTVFPQQTQFQKGFTKQDMEQTAQGLSVDLTPHLSEVLKVAPQAQAPPPSQEQPQPQLSPPDRHLEQRSEGITADQARAFAQREQDMMHAHAAAQGAEGTGGKKVQSDNHPALPRSFRSGPTEKPLTLVQIELLVKTLSELRGSYTHDKQLVSILSGYIEDIKAMEAVDV